MRQHDHTNANTAPKDQPAEMRRVLGIVPTVQHRSDSKAKEYAKA